MVQSQLNSSNVFDPSTHHSYSRERDLKELSKTIVVVDLPFSFVKNFDFLYYIQIVYNLHFRDFQETQLKQGIFYYKRSTF